MTIFFLCRLTGFFLSVLFVNHWINCLFSQTRFYDSRALPKFAWGWLLYFFIYFIGFITASSVDLIRIIFTGLSFSIPLMGAILFISNLNIIKLKKYQFAYSTRNELLLTFLLIMGLLYIGPYLEFPSDPVEHLIRIQSWESVNVINQNTSFNQDRFIYFLNHWLLQGTGVDLGNRSSIHLLSALLAGMLFWQFTQLTKFFLTSPKYAWLGGILSLGLFGTNLFSFYRYYVLAPSFVAYLVFLEMVILISFFFFKEQFRYIALLPPLLIFCWQNHPQEVLLICNAWVGICFIYQFIFSKKLLPHFKWFLHGMTGIIVIVSVFIFTHDSPLFSFDLRPVEGITSQGPTLWGWQMEILRFSRLNDVLGILGWFMMIVSLGILIFQRKNKKLVILAIMCLWPLLVLWNPYAIDILKKAINAKVFHRLAYGSIYWVLLISLIPLLYRQRWALFPHFLVRHTPPANYIIGSLALLVSMIAFLPQFPTYGKMPHLWIRTNSSLDGKNLSEAIQFLRKEAMTECVDPYPLSNRPIRTYVYGDRYVNAYLKSTGYFHVITDRWETPLSIFTQTNPQLIDNKFQNLDQGFDKVSFSNFIKQQQVCYVVLFPQENSPLSWVGATSGHWPANYVHTKPSYTPQFLSWMTNKHFKRVFHKRNIQIFKVL